jgi:hypothetical protein
MTDALSEGRQADSVRRRQRVIKALNAATANGAAISVSAIARAARVDHTFLYRHRGLLAQIHAAQTRPTDSHGTGVGRESLHAGLVNAKQSLRQTHLRLSCHHRRDPALAQSGSAGEGLVLNEPNEPRSRARPWPACAPVPIPRSW